jgi:hypothetical protein
MFQQGDFRVNENADELQIILRKKLQSIREVSKEALFGMDQ